MSTLTGKGLERGLYNRDRMSGDMAGIRRERRQYLRVLPPVGAGPIGQRHYNGSFQAEGLAH